MGEAAVGLGQVLYLGARRLFQSKEDVRKRWILLRAEKNEKGIANMKVIIITASVEDEMRPPEIQDNSHYPIGLGYLHSFIESKGHNVTTLFLNDYEPEECINISIRSVEDVDPDVIGLQIMTCNRGYSFRLIEHINNKYQDKKIIFLPTSFLI